MTSVVDKYYRRIAQNIDNVTMKFDISALLVKSKEHDSKIDTNKENVSENLTLINSKSDIIESNKNNISENLTLINSKSDINESNENNIPENLTLINSNENGLNNTENDIVNINTKVRNNYNISQINKNDIDSKTKITDNHITAINSTLTNIQNDLKIKNNNFKYSIENFLIYNIEIENSHILNNDNPKFSIFNYDSVDDFRKDYILEINGRLLYDYNTYNNIGKLIHNYKLYDGESVLFHEFKLLKTNAGYNLKDDLSQIDLFYVKLNKDHDRIKIELILSMIEGVTGSVICKLYNSFNSNFLCLRYIKEIKIVLVYMYNIKLYFPKNIKELNKDFENKNNNFKINSIRNLENYFKKLKNKSIYDTSRLL